VKPRNYLLLLSVFLLAIGIIGFWKQHSDTYKTPSLSQLGTVTRVVDGDSLTVQIDGRYQSIRLCGMDAPEQKQPFGKEAKATLEKLALGKQVAITEVGQDPYRRVIAEVFVLGEPEQFVNGDLVQSGMAYHYVQYSGNCPNRDAIALAESIAKEQKAGVWSGNYQPPWEFRKAQRKN